MPDILIRGMEMPKHCIGCPCMVDKYGGDNCCLQSEEANEKITSWDDMKAGCPLHELPEHGDLVDASKISLQEYEQAAHDALHNGKGSILYDCGVLVGARAITQFVRRQPVIVPANKEGSE